MKTPSMLSRENPAITNDCSWSILIRAEKSNRYHVTATTYDLRGIIYSTLQPFLCRVVTEVSVLNSNISLYLR